MEDCQPKIGYTETFTRMNSSSILRLQTNHSHDEQKIAVLGQNGEAVRRSI